MINFRNKKENNYSSKKTNPIELYDLLDRQSVTGPLRPNQKSILEEWFNSRFNEKDLIIKLHTGEGKTLIGLLMLYSKLNATSKPSLFVCPNKYLVEQVCLEATKFGIPFCQIEGDLPDDFLLGKKILITHVQKLFNGKTIFGIDNMSVKIGSIILDDSHACIDAIKNSFSIRIPKKHELYNSLMMLFEEDLRHQGEGSYLDIESENIETIMPIPYWAWIDKKLEVTKLIGGFKTEQLVLFVWPIIKDHLEKCQAFISGNEIEIMPFNIPLDRFGTFKNADQRILMSATTQDDSFFIRGLDFSIDSVRNPLTIPNIKWSGEKMLLIPSLIDESLDRDTVINLFARPIKRNYGIVSLVSSFRKAILYKELGSFVTDTRNIFDKVTELKKGNYQETVVVVNRYDGIDLPDESCRILVIDSMPYFTSFSESYEQTCRMESDIINIKIAQKIEQGLGRSVRGEKDYTVILILGADLVKFVKSIRTSKFFSTQTRNQIQIGLKIADMARDELMGNAATSVLNSVIQQSLKRDEGWKEFYNEEMDKHIDPIPRNDMYNLLQAEKECEAANFIGDYETACTKMQNLVDSINGNNSERGWFLQSLARFKYNISKSESNKIQKNAFQINSQLLAPKDGISYKRIEAINENRIRRIKDYISNYKDFGELTLAINSILSDFTFGVEADKFETALFEIGSLLGFISQRPDKEFRKGPDNLWCGIDNKYFIFECKSQVIDEREDISKREAGQMNSHCGWFESEYGQIPAKRIMITPTKNLSYFADFTHEVQIMRKGKLNELKNNIKFFIKEFKLYNVNELGEHKIDSFLIIHKLSIENLLNNYSETYFKKSNKQSS